MAKIIQEIKYISGIPLGGIGAGSVEIRPDGLFHEWRIFGGDMKDTDATDKKAQFLKETDNVFLIRTEDEKGNIVMRFLALDENLLDLFSMPYLKCVEKIEFEGRFPQARLKYIDGLLPVDIEAEFISSFIPLDEKKSGIPGFYVKFNVKNKTEKTIGVSILNLMVNPAAQGQKKAKPFDNVVQGNGSIAVLLSADDMAEGHPTTGNMTVSATGGTLSYIAGGFKNERYGRVFHSPNYGTKEYSYLNIFKEHGFLPDISYPKKPRYDAEFDAGILDNDSRVKLLYDLSKIPFVFDKCRVIGEITDIMEDDAELTRFINDTIKDISEMSDIPWGEAALCSRFTLDAASIEAETEFTYSWYFPNHMADGENIGHMYENRYANSYEVNENMTQNNEEYIKKSERFVGAIYENGINESISDAISNRLTALNQCTWWAKDSSVGFLEGVGGHMPHTLGSVYHGSFPVISLFPHLQMKQMEHYAELKEEDGRIAQNLASDFLPAGAGLDFALQMVMLVSRDYQWTGDRRYLDKMYGYVVSAMERAEKLDTDGDGLPDKDTEKNAYNGMGISGTASYMSSLWLGALSAAKKLAGAKGDEENLKKWQNLLQKGTQAFENKLWNGEYYILCMDKEGNADECCMTGQISAEWFLSVMVWDSVLRRDRIKSALKSIIKYNYKPDTGLINASYPEDKDFKMRTYLSAKANAVWTEAEYAAAAQLINCGIPQAAMEVIKDIDFRFKRNGGYSAYFDRLGAMSSWTLLISLTGFEFDADAGLLKIVPKSNKIGVKYPYFTPYFWGIYSVCHSSDKHIYSISVSDGRYDLKELILPKEKDIAISGARITHNADDINADIQVGENEIKVCLKNVQLNAGDNLSVEI